MPPAEQRTLPFQESLNALMAAIPGVVYQFRVFPNGDWAFLYLSPGIASLYEISPEDAYANPDALTHCIFPEDRPDHRASVEQACHTLTPWMHEHRISTPSGQMKWVRGQATPTLQPDGSVLWAGILMDITASKQTEEALRLSEARYRAIVEGQTELVCRFLPDGTLTYVNDAYCRYFGQSSDTILAANFMPLIPEEDRAFVAAQMTLCTVEHPSHVCEHRVIRGDGEVRWIQWTDQLILDAQGLPFELQSVGRDITERKQVEESLRFERDGHRNLLETVEAIIVSIDPLGRISLINRKGCQLLGYGADELIGKDWFETCLPSTIDRNQVRDVFQKTLARDLAGSEYFENAVLTRSGAERLIAWHNNTLRDRDGKVIGVLSAGEDITERKEQQRQLEHIAHYDPLTRLPNRVLLADRLHQEMAQTLRRGQHLGVAYLDLDGFKAINDQHGHATGDQMLIAVANRMKSALREGDILARLGGDEFVAVLIDLTDINDCVPLLNRLLAAAAEPVPVGDLVLQVSVSIGVAFYPQTDDVDGDQLLRQSDRAMYQAKQSGKNRFHRFAANSL
jgi:diguanylate cyclase (GGDEF)-like protein/PAS domain S-box-containing protein